MDGQRALFFRNPKIMEIIVRHLIDSWKIDNRINILIYYEVYYLLLD